MNLTPASRRRRLTAIALLFAILAIAEGGLVALAGLVVTLQRRGDMSTTDAAVFDLLGVSAVIGIVIALLALAGCVTALRGRPRRALSAAGLTLAWLRLAAIPVAALAIAAAIGADAVTGLGHVLVICLALLVAGCGVFAVGSAYRLTYANP